MMGQILEEIQRVKSEFSSRAKTISNLRDLENLRIEFTSKKGKIQTLFGVIAKAAPVDRPRIGAELNALKDFVQATLDEKSLVFQTQRVQNSVFDPTLPGRTPRLGGLHPLLQVMDEIKNIFMGMGFRVEEGPKIETQYHNFEALNIPKDHPSRDMHDTFYLENEYVLRTHTSPIQIRTMERQKPPIRMIAPGKCYRKDTPDATHSPIFHQVEGLYVDKGVSFADLKGTLQVFAHKLLGSEVNVRFRPSFFPFTEPSAEYDFSCIFCKGKGCSFCKGTGWLEISGAGMVNPAVFEFVGIDPEVYTGYAFGMGVERIALLLFEINDIRIFYENDLRFLSQF